MTSYTRAEVCVVACAEAFRGDGEIMASPMGIIPAIGARLAKATFEPDLLLTSEEATVVSDLGALGSDPEMLTVESWMPYRTVFDTLWWGRRHVMMGATQVDCWGNQNISCIGSWENPTVQLLGVRGAPGNTMHHATSYWVSSHTTRTLVQYVDVVSGVGHDRAQLLSSEQRRFHDIRCVVTNLGVFDFATHEGRMQVRSLHPGVGIDEVREQTGFDVVATDVAACSREPTTDELYLIREVIDPNGLRNREVGE